MTTLVQGAFNEAALAPLGKRVIVRELSPGVSMVDVDGVPSQTVAQVLRDSGAAVIAEAPAVAEPERPEPVVTFAPPSPPPACMGSACQAAPCSAQSCTADNRPVLAAIAAITAPTVDLRPVLDAVRSLPRQTVSGLPALPAPVPPWWERWSPAMAAGGVALLFELVARLH